jgi:hypothetical protein
MSRVLTGARSWLRSRPRGQRAGALAGVALLVSAPFGGLEAVPPPPLAAIEVEQPFDVGPFEVTVRRVVSVPDLEPIARPERRRNRLLGIVAEVHNLTDRPEYLTLLPDSLTARGAGVTGREPELFVVSDGTRPSMLNPGMSEEMVIVLEHQPGLGETLRLDVLGFTFVEDSVLTLDEDYWLPGDVALSGDFPVEERD